MNAVDREALIERLAHAIAPADPTSLAAYGLAKAAVDLVQDRSEEQCKLLTKLLYVVLFNNPRVGDAGGEAPR